MAKRLILRNHEAASLHRNRRIDFQALDHQLAGGPAAEVFTTRPPETITIIAHNFRAWSVSTVVNTIELKIFSFQ